MDHKWFITIKEECPYCKGKSFTATNGCYRCHETRWLKKDISISDFVKLINIKNEKNGV